MLPRSFGFGPIRRLFRPHSIFIVAALLVTTGIASAAGITEIKTYQSTISTDAQGALDLKMEVNYNNAVSNAPVMVTTHQYSDAPDLFDQVRPNAQQLRDQGFFVITVAMRGRMGSDGVRDSGGLEIYDIFDAVEAAKAQYGSFINPNNINVTGYSGGGGNTMAALTKFPDYFRTGGAFYGMSDYGYDLTNGWYNNGAGGGHKTQLDTDIGNPNTPTALITSRYMARASNLASRNNPYSEIHFFVNSDEPTCPPINDTSYRNNAIAAASFTGEFSKITIHTGTAGTYQDFNGNGTNESNEQQYWPHTTLTTDQQASGLSWYLSRVLNGSIPAPVLNTSDNLFVAGFVRTKKFSFFVGDGQNGAGSLIYALSAGVKTFTFDLQSTYAVTGKLTVDTADMSGQTVSVVRNGVVTATFAGGGTYQVTGIADNETVRLVAQGIVGATTNEIQYLSGTDKDNTVPWDFRVSAGRNAAVWTTIPVPSCWETKGFGSYEYGYINTTEQGDYKKTFTVPANWAGKRVFLVFEGSMTDTTPLINGVSPGGGGTVVPAALPNDRAFNNSASTGPGQSGGIAASASGNVNLGTLASFTLACWVKPEADYSTVGSSNSFPRIIQVGPSGYDGSGNGAYLSVFNNGSTARALEFKAPGVDVLSSANVLSGNDWTFVAVTYDSTQSSNQVKFYVGSRSAALASPVSTATASGAASVPFGTAAFAYLLNRGSDRGRAFDGWGDDFRIFNGALTQAQLETVRGSGLSASVTPPTPLYQWNFNNATSGTTVTPVVGAGGVLTLQNSAGTATDLYSAIGGGVSGSQSAVSSVVHQGSFYEFSYDVTSNLNYGASNLLEVNVKKVSANASVNDAERTADYWVFGGIHRPVYLEARPATHIERVAVDAKASGQITVNTFLSGVSSSCTVAARVTDMNNVALGSEFTATAATNATSATLSATLPTPNPWSPEFPNLYKLIVEIRDGATVLCSRTETIGFRTIGFVANSGFTLNGKKIVMRGVNRHEFWPTDGRTTSRAVSIADIELMKSLNMNAVRMSHYPPSKHFLEECDRLGLLVLDELAGWQGAYDDAIGPGLVREMVIRDVNHPCILAWDNGNEGGHNGTVDDDFGLWDPQNRKVLHPTNWPGDTTAGVRTHHYADYNTFIGYLGAGLTVYMPTEIQHGLYDGGGGAGLADHWNAMRTAPNGGGMFIWAFLDEGLVRDDQGGAIDVAGSNAPDGIVGPYREKEASYYTVKALWSPVQITAPNPATFTGSLAVENRFDFTNLNQCTFHWDLGWFPDPADSTAVQNSGFIVGATSTAFAGPSVAPGASGTLALGLPGSLTRFDMLRVTAKDPTGREIYTWTWPLHSVAQVHDRLVRVPAAATASLTPSVNNGVLSVTNGTRTWQFDLTTGRLNGVTVSGQPVSLSNGPRPVTGTWTTSSVTHGFDGADYLVTMNNVTSATDGFQWRIHPNGWVNLKYRYTLTGAQKWLGITFDYPEANVTGMRWLGQGPYRVWKNRLEGQEIGVNYKAANNTVNGTQWGYPEFRGYHGQLYWAQLGTTQQPITLTTDTSNLFLRVLTPALTPPNDTGRTNVNPAFPAGNLSLLHAINAIGNKFQAPGATTTGPSSADTTATGLYEGSVDLYFGALPYPGTDRDGNGLSDSWELQNFNTLGNDATADTDGDGLKLMLENAFDLSPSAPDANSSRLPVLELAMNTIAMMGFHMPELRWNEFRYLPEISGDLKSWFDADTHPDYFQIASSVVGDERAFEVEPGLGWPGNDHAVFMRLRINRK
jgi:hypothetical protein